MSNVIYKFTCFKLIFSPAVACSTPLASILFILFSGSPLIAFFPLLHMLEAKFFSRLNTARFISSSSRSPFKESLSLRNKAFFQSTLTYASIGFLFSALPTFPSWNAFTRPPVAPLPAASCLRLSLFFTLRRAYLPYESPGLSFPSHFMGGPFFFQLPFPF